MGNMKVLNLIVIKTSLFPRAFSVWVLSLWSWLFCFFLFWSSISSGRWLNNFYWVATGVSLLQTEMFGGKPGTGQFWQLPSPLVVPCLLPPPNWQRRIRGGLLKWAHTALVCTKTFLHAEQEHWLLFFGLLFFLMFKCCELLPFLDGRVWSK